jgi:hypothetical protein
VEERDPVERERLKIQEIQENAYEFDTMAVESGEYKSTGEQREEWEHRRSEQGDIQDKWRCW